MVYLGSWPVHYKGNQWLPVPLYEPAEGNPYWFVLLPVFLPVPCIAAIRSQMAVGPPWPEPYGTKVPRLRTVTIRTMRK